MNLTRSAIEKNRITLVVIVLTLISGVLAYRSLPKAQDPGFTIRTALITTRLPGASPERMELLVTDKIEKKVQEMPEVDTILSESRTGISIVTVNFLESYSQMRPIFDDLRRKVEDVSKDLPQGTIPPEVNDEFGDVFGSVYALTGEGFDYAELKTIADQIRDDLLKIPEVAKVEIHGAQEEAIFVEYANAQLTELGLSPQRLSMALTGVNILSSGGSVVSGRERIALEPTGNFESVADLAKTTLPLPGGGVAYLGDIATVTRGYKDPPRSLARSDGSSALAIAVSMREGGDILKLGEILDRRVPELEASYPWGIRLERIWFQAELVKQSIASFVSSLLQAVAIVVLVMVAFLGLRTGLVVAALIPTAIIISFFVMQQFGININQISLAALIIALGLLVDNAIVMVESVLVKREAGVGPLDAAVESGQELKLPLLISSLTTGAAFLPIAMAESAVGEYTSDIFYVVTITLLVSWLVSMTLIPLLTTVAIRVKQTAASDQALSGRGYDFYRRVLLASLRHRLLFGAGVFLSFFLAVQGLGLVPQIFIAPSEDPVFTGNFELPLGTSIETSEAVMADIDAFVRRSYVEVEQPRLSNWLTYIGSGGPRFYLSLSPPNPNPANSFLVGSATEGRYVDEVIAGITDYARVAHPDLSVKLSRLENGPPVGYPINVRLSGDSADQLFLLADQVSDWLLGQPGVASVKNSWGLQTKKLIVDVDQDRAQRAGVTSEEVAYSLKASLSGIDMTQYREGDQLIPVTLRTVASDRQDIGKLEGLSVYSQATGRSVPLEQVADIRLAFEGGIIERRDRQRTLSLKVQLVPGVTAADVNAELRPWLQQVEADWPSGYRFEIGGEAEESGDANASIAAKLPMGMMIIVLLLVFQFNSVRRPLIILATIPLGMIGVTIGLIIARSSFGFFTILGIISLAGIIINNAIVLIDRIAIEKEELGKEHRQAVVDACIQRLRPIMLTTATTVMGMLPLWWGGTAMFKPMAISIIFGLLFATLLTLLVVPVLYSVLFRLRYAGEDWKASAAV
ncbi:MAG: efflux RND transporter permease subunit [Xanthomonadales bacterium]|nr:efflux RND transporter permease subunit [Xanthomonadales bacterium]